MKLAGLDGVFADIDGIIIKSARKIHHINLIQDVFQRIYHTVSKSVNSNVTRLNI